MGRRANDRTRAQHSSIRRRVWFAAGDDGGPDLARLEIRDEGAIRDGADDGVDGGRSAGLPQRGVLVDPYVARETGLVVGGLHFYQVNDPKSR